MVRRAIELLLGLVMVALVSPLMRGLARRGTRASAMRAEEGR